LGVVRQRQKGRRGKAAPSCPCAMDGEGGPVADEESPFPASTEVAQTPQSNYRFQVRPVAFASWGTNLRRAATAATATTIDEDGAGWMNVLGGGSRIFLPPSFQVPRGVVARALRRLEPLEAPGEIEPGVLLAALQRFHKVFCRDHNTSLDEKVFEELILSRSAAAEPPLGRGSGSEALLEVDDSVCEIFSVHLTPLERLYFTLDMAENSTLSSSLVSTTIFFAVLLSLLFWIAGTVTSVRIIPCAGEEVNTCVPRVPPWMGKVEDVCVWIFTAEILLRLISVSHARRELLNQGTLISVISGNTAGMSIMSPSPCSRLCSFLRSPSAFFDILSVVPYWVETLCSEEWDGGISALRVLYVARVTRVFKLGRALNADLGQLNEVFDLLGKVLVNAAPAIVMTVSLIVIALCAFGTFAWFYERGEWVSSTDPRYLAVQVEGMNPDGVWLRTCHGKLNGKPSPFSSIPASFWWTIVTITTVGYGDQVPCTVEGKLVGACAMLYGIVILGLPLFVVGARFGEEYDRLIKSARRRKDALDSKGARRNATASDDVAAASRHIAVVTDNFAEEYADFLRTLETNCPAAGVPYELVYGWLESLHTCLVGPKPAVTMDRLGIRILAYIAEAERASGGHGSLAAEELAAATEDEEDRNRACCRRIRLAWHRLSVTCCQLEGVPKAALAGLLSERVKAPDTAVWNPSKCCGSDVATMLAPPAVSTAT